MAMDADDDMFAGMDFVSFSDASDFPHQPHPFPHEDLPDQSESQPSDPVLSEMPVPGSSELVASTFSNRTSIDSTNRTSIDSIMAAYETVNSTPAPHPSTAAFSFIMKPLSDSLKPGIRRKRRSVKIGYGRSAEDAEDLRSSAQDETASNGSAIDEHNIDPSGIRLTSLDDGHRDVISPIKTHRIGSGYQSDAHEHADDSAVIPNSMHVTDSDPDVVHVNVDGVSESHDSLCTISPEIKDAVENLQAESPCQKESETEIVQIPASSAVSKADDATTTSTEGDYALASSDPLDGSEINLSATDSTDEETRANSTSSTLEDEMQLDIEVPPELSIEEQLIFIKRVLARNAQCIEQQLASVSQGRKLAAQKRRQAAEKVSTTLTEFKQVEEEIEAACENEDFDKAESLNAALAVAEKTHETALQEFRNTEMEYDKYASKMQEIIQMQVAIEEKGCMLLDQLALEALATAKSMKESAEEKSKQDMDALAADEEAAKMKKKKLMLELRVVEEAKLDLHNAINNSIEAESQEKNHLLDERQVFVNELNALLEAVKIKEAEIAAHDKRIGDLEAKINNRISGFDRESSELETEVQNLSSSLESIEKELENLSAQKLQTDIQLTKAQEEHNKLIEFSRMVKAESENLQDAMHVRKNVAQAALLSKEKRLMLASVEKELLEAVHILKNESLSRRTTLQELASEKVKLQQESQTASQQIMSIEKRAPEIEAEKKLAAASRNFKEAGRLANEAKTLLSSKERITNDLKRITEELQRLDQEIEGCMSELAGIEQQLLAKERDAAKARCERLRLIASATRDERDAAAELEDFEEAESLHVEAEAADKEADELQKLHCFEGVVYTRMLSRAFTVSSSIKDTRISENGAVVESDA